LLQAGTKLCLEASGEISVVGLASRGAEVLGLVAQHQPDVLVLDLHLPDLAGMEVVRRVRAAYPAVAVLVLTGHDEAGYVRPLLQRGIRGFLRKSVSCQEVVAAVCAVAAGRTVLVSEAARAAAENSMDLLTAREYEVLRLMATGLRNGEVAEELGVSVKAVEFHVTHVLAKLSARSRAEAIIKAQQHGLVSLPDTTRGVG